MANYSKQDMLKVLRKWLKNEEFYDYVKFEECGDFTIHRKEE